MVSAQQLLSKFLKEEITKAKIKHSPLFEIGDLEQYNKQIDYVAAQMLKVVSKYNINSHFLGKLFVKATFPLNGSHKALNALKHAWKVFRETKFDNECLILAQYITTSKELKQADQELNQFFKNWNELSAKLKSDYKEDKETQPFFIEKAYSGDFYAYKAGLKIYFFTRPILLKASTLGDIILNKETLHRFLTIGFNMKVFFSENISISFLAKKDYDETQYFINNMMQKYVDSYQKDSTLRDKKLRQTAARKTHKIKRDEDFLKNL